MTDHAMAIAAMTAANMTREAFGELSDAEYDALVRMAQVQGTEALARMIGPLETADRRATITAFMNHEVQVAQERIAALETAQRELQVGQERMAALEAAQLALQVQQQAAPAAAPLPPSLKVDVTKYRGNDNESLLRWLVELDIAIEARPIRNETLKVTFAMSNLAGRARTWAYGRRLADPAVFLSYEEFKTEIKAAFEPPKTEFRARSEFLDLKQGKRDIQAYCQYARYLVSCVVSDPIDDSTQVVTFLKGLTDGPVKTYLFREYPETLENAISLALQEDFSLQQAYVHSSTYRPPRASQMHEYDGAEPMDLSVAADGRNRPSNRSCHRCGKSGHLAFECMAPRPVPKAQQKGAGYRSQRNGRRFDARRRNDNERLGSGNRQQPKDDRSKNDRSQ